jgi:hypothetical protein
MTDDAILRQYARKERGGPYDLVKRDDELIIRRRNLNQPPMRTYIYDEEPGDVIEFIAETAIRQTPGSANIRVKIFDKDTKQYTEVVVNEATMDNTRLNEMVEKKLEGFELERVIQSGKWTNQEVDLESPETYQSVYKVTKGDQRISTGAVTDIDGYTVEGVKYNSRAAGFLNKDMVYVSAIESTGVQLEGWKLTHGNEVVSHTAKDPKDAVREGVDIRTEQVEQKNSGTLVVIGDPKIESGKVVTIKGAADFDNGNYYIIRSEHDLDASSGYIVTNEITRNGVPDDSTPRTKATAIKAGVNRGLGPVKSTNTRYSKNQ